MKKQWMMSLFGASALALALTACGSADKLHGPEAEPPPAPDVTSPPPGPDTHGEPPAERRFELRMRGVGAEGFTSMRLPISRVSVTTLEGKLLPVQQRASVLELATAGHSPLLAHFDVPADLERVRITVYFADLGEFDRHGKHEKLDARGAPLSFEAKVSDLAVRGRAVLALDVARSVVPFASSSVVLPSGNLQY
ncbi:hypothetical protein [Myxococcus landrumensis]|uniref:Lipoprotein n=1 Tax=Myxococcus landrumensis TaxID=2813577 RepID=A0ABX7N7N0_9BACT|nr:hypothetical protein [Myxococcus landrumus]QSQ14439.1 hypothetical protein JY572_40130 [Myxococcus landrumus]